MIKISVQACKAIEHFKFIKTIELFQGKANKTEINIYMPRINGKEFDNDDMKNALEEVVVDFALNRKSIIKYKERESYMAMSREARQKFRTCLSNKGELGELLLYTFLEGVLKAPKILSKMSLKTTPGDYTKLSDAIHYLNTGKNDKYHLVFGEAKMYRNLTAAFGDACSSIAEHRKNKRFEIGLISSSLDTEFDDEDKELIESILYPKSDKDSIKVSDAFGIFIGFEIENGEGEGMSEEDYEVWIEEHIVLQVEKRVAKFEEKIIKNGLGSKKIYLYMMPFIMLDETRTEITKGVTD